MNNTEFACPPLTTDNILSLKGQPVSKKISPNQAISSILEEWNYYNGFNKTKECYLFENGRLVVYKKEKTV
jgi:hypothetical protein